MFRDELSEFRQTWPGAVMSWLQRNETSWRGQMCRHEWHHLQDRTLTGERHRWPRIWQVGGTFVRLRTSYHKYSSCVYAPLISLCDRSPYARTILVKSALLVSPRTQTSRTSPNLQVVTVVCFVKMSTPQLRAVTYLCPSLPVELFQAILEILEAEAGLTATLLYDWRSDGPDEAKPDPFQANQVDIGIISFNLVIDEVKSDKLCLIIY